MSKNYIQEELNKKISMIQDGLVALMKAIDQPLLSSDFFCFELFSSKNDSLKFIVIEDDHKFEIKILLLDKIELSEINHDPLIMIVPKQGYEHLIDFYSTRSVFLLKKFFELSKKKIPSFSLFNTDFLIQASNQIIDEIEIDSLKIKLEELRLLVESGSANSKNKHVFDSDKQLFSIGNQICLSNKDNGFLIQFDTILYPYILVSSFSKTKTNPKELSKLNQLKSLLIKDKIDHVVIEIIQDKIIFADQSLIHDFEFLLDNVLSEVSDNDLKIKKKKKNNSAKNLCLF